MSKAIKMPEQPELGPLVSGREFKRLFDAIGQRGFIWLNMAFGFEHDFIERQRKHFIDPSWPGQSDDIAYTGMHYAFVRGDGAPRVGDCYIYLSVGWLMRQSELVRIMVENSLDKVE